MELLFLVLLFTAPFWVLALASLVLEALERREAMAEWASRFAPEAQTYKEQKAAWYHDVARFHPDWPWPDRME